MYVCMYVCMHMYIYIYIYIYSTGAYPTTGNILLRDITSNGYTFNWVISYYGSFAGEETLGNLSQGEPLV